MNKINRNIHFNKPVKITNRILIITFSIVLFLITVFSVYMLANIKFKNKMENAIVKEKLSNSDLSGIKYLDVSNNLILFVNYTEPGIKNSMPPIFAAPNIMLRRMGDTLLIQPIKFERNKWMPVQMGSYAVTLENLEQIRAASRANIMLRDIKGKSLRLIAAENGGIFVRPEKEIDNASIIAGDDSNIEIVNCKNISADLKNNSVLLLKNKILNIKGTLRNRSHIEVTGDQVDLKGLVKKDSSAVIFR